ncbi:VanZ family protein [Ligilactobacillus ubinensis]|uniref:VanZ family protein n=1 Tax=Ligilactobacillus ubinensis TaxID=2876789 RepID=UPI0023DE7EDA|nr:VanZ family protein [Ligilactobacillus ubinensis]
MALKSKINIYIFFVLIIMLVLFISSSMTYKQQTVVPGLAKYLPNKPFESTLRYISFHYAGETVAIKEIGYYKFVEFFIRKGAHFFIYCMMGAFFYLGLKDKLEAIFLTVFVSWLATLGYAAFDEFHQMLTGGRTPLFQDVMLDGSGAFLGIILATIFLMFWNKKKQNGIYW